MHSLQRRRCGRRSRVRRVRRAPRHRRSELHVRGAQDRAAPRRPRAEPRRAAERRREPRVRVADHAPPLHGRADHSQDSADDLVSGEQRPGNLRHRHDPRRRDGARRHWVGRGVREVVQQAAARLRSGQRRLVHTWTGDDWRKRDAADLPRITHAHFTGTGTRTIRANGARAIEELFTRSFANPRGASS